MAKLKPVYVCTECGAQFPKWIGQCLDCNAWNSLVEEIVATASNVRRQSIAGYAGVENSNVTLLANVVLAETGRISTGLFELDRVLGGGLVAGSVVLVGGDPGIGKSTLLLQTLCELSQHHPALYITGEESLQQVTARAQRLELPRDFLYLLTETQVERIIHVAQQQQPRIMVIDSIQTIHTELMQSAPGSVGQVRESAAALVRYAKQSNTVLFLVGHVTKEGALAGPRVLEHMVDTVLYFEGQHDNRFRVIRAIKNRFGAVNELGIFAMTEKGLKQVSNPSAIFLSNSQQLTSGSAITVSWEGSRPLLVEVQALVDESHLANPRRVTVGLEQNRLSMLLAVLHRHAGIVMYDQDVFVNVVGGLRVTETAVDLAQMFAVVSSLKNRVLPNDMIVFGEIGLAGEVRPVQNGQERLREAMKHGFKKAIIPKGNMPKKAIEGIEVIGVQRLQEGLAHI